MTQNPEEFLICPHCGETHHAGAKFCPTTGKPITHARQIHQCPACGREVDPAWNNCVYCGAQISSPAGIERPFWQSKLFWITFAVLGLALIAAGGFFILNGLSETNPGGFALFGNPDPTAISESMDSTESIWIAQQAEYTAATHTSTHEEAQATAVEQPASESAESHPSLSSVPETETESAAQTDIPLITITPTQASTPTRTVIPSVTPTRTRMPFYEEYDFAFASDKSGDFRVYLTYSDDFSTTLEVPLPEEYQSAWYPSFCASGIAMEVSSKTIAPSKWIYLFYPTDDQFYRWQDKPPYTALAVPRCSSDGEYISYSAFLRDEYFLQVAKLDNEHLLFELEDTYPDASESYTSGYASFPFEGNTFISMANLDRSQFYTMLLTTDFQRTSSLGFGKYPAFSPDGKQVAYLCNREDSLCVAPLNGSPTELAPLVSHLVRGATMPMGTPWWSRDGEWIYYSSSDGGDWDIFRIRPDGSDRENLTADWPSNELTPMVRW